MLRDSNLHFSPAVFLSLIFFQTLFPQKNISPTEVNKPTLQDTVLAIQFIELADSHFNTARYDSSNFYYEKAKEIYSELSKLYDQDNIWVGLVRCSNNIGRNLIRQNKYEIAMEQLSYSLEIGLDKFGENHPDIAVSFNNIGVVYGYKKDFNKALENYQKSLSIRLKLFGEENSDVAKSYDNLGYLYFIKNEFDQALNFCLKSLSIRTRVLGEDHPDVANSCYHIGFIYYRKDDFDKALEYYQKSLAINLNFYGESHKDVASDLNHIGNVYWFKGDYDKALESYKKALSVRLGLHGENHSFVAREYSNIGNIYGAKGDYDQALEFINKSLSIRLSTLGEDHPDVAFSYGKLGGLYREAGDYDQALNYMQKSLSIMLHSFGEQDINTAEVYNAIGNVYYYKTNYESALQYYLKSLNIRLGMFGEKHAHVALTYFHIAEVYEKRQLLDSALIFCQKSIISLASEFNDLSVYSNPSLYDIGSELNLLNALELKAEIFAVLSRQSDEKKNLEHSQSIYLLVADLIDKMRTGYKAEGSKLFLGEKTIRIYDRAIQTSLKIYELTGNDEFKHQAFYFSEKSKANVLQDELAEVQAKKFAKLSEQLIDDEKQLRIDLAFYDTQLQNEYAKKASQDSAKIIEYENQLFDLNARYAQLISDLEKNYPDYYNLKYQTRISSVQEIQNQLPGNTALLDYFVGDSVIYLFSISNDNFDIFSLKKPGDFPQLVRDYYSSIIKSETEKYLSSAAKLSEILIAPVTHRIRDTEKLVIIPHDLLYKIPFEALCLENPAEKKDYIDYSKIDYLIKEFDISYHYSATLYINGLTKEKESLAEGNPDLVTARSQQKSFIGFAPVFPENDLTGYTLASTDLDFLSADSDDLLRSLTIDGKKFDELKHSEWEIQDIIELFADKSNDKNGTAYFYSDATEDAFKKNVGKYRIVHMATHSFINESHPDISGIIFAQPLSKEYGNTGVSEDGILYAGETYNLDLNADLVVLSSCESGLGKLIRGEGMMALTRGFLYSGANNIIFSLWKIPDKHTSELMIEFYTQMLSGNGYAESLRKAKLKLMESELTARPRSWAGFIMIGSKK